MDDKPVYEFEDPNVYGVSVHSVNNQRSLKIKKGTLIILNGATIVVREDVCFAMDFPEDYKGKDILKTDLRKIITPP
jgi:hypothetical protein